MCSGHIAAGMKSISLLSSNIELQDLNLTLLGFHLTFVCDFFIILPFLPFEMVMFILCFYMLKVYHLIFDFVGGLQLIYYLESQKRLWIETLNSVVTVKDYGDF